MKPLPTRPQATFVEAIAELCLLSLPRSKGAFEHPRRPELRAAFRRRLRFRRRSQRLLNIGTGSQKDIQNP